MRHTDEEQELARLLKGAWPLKAAGTPAQAVAAMMRAGQTRRHWPAKGLVAAVAVVVVAALVVIPRPVHRPGVASAPRPATPRVAVGPAAPKARSESGARVAPVANRTQAGGTASAALAAAKPVIGTPLVAVVFARAATSGQGQALLAGERLPAGAVLRTAKGGRLDLVTRRGSELMLDAGSEVALARDGRSMALAQGRLYLANRSHEFAAVTAAAGRIELLGTTIDAAVRDQRLAVTVVAGQVRLANAHGQALVSAGRKAILVADATPDGGQMVNVAAETAWYDGRGEVFSDSGEIAYLVARRPDEPKTALTGTQRDFLATEVWAMRTDGSGKHRVKSYTGSSCRDAGPWLPSGHVLVTPSFLGWQHPDWVNHAPWLFEGGFGEGLSAAPDYFTSVPDWALDVATGQDAPFSLPTGYLVFQKEVSPDGRLVAFSGGYRQDPTDWQHGDTEAGTWVYNLVSGSVKKMLDSGSDPFCWSPDSRSIAMSRGPQAGPEQPLVTVAVNSGKVRELGVWGIGPRFSPDGTKLVFVGGWGPDGNPASSKQPTSAFVLDLTSGGEPLRITPPLPLTCQPQWSPDGTRVLYWRRVLEPDRYSLWVAQADGSGNREIYRAKGFLHAAEWSPTGDRVVTVATPPYIPGQPYYDEIRDIMSIPADGSGPAINLGGTAQDSVLPPAEQADMQAAVADLYAARQQFGTAKLLRFEGRETEARAAFRAAADGFASLVYNHPLARFGPQDLARYVDFATANAELPLAEAQHQACTLRQRVLSAFLARFAIAHRRFPKDFTELRTWLVQVQHEQPEEIAPAFSCPVETNGQPTPYIYNDQAWQRLLKWREVIVSCPQHPDLVIRWDMSFIATFQMVDHNAPNLEDVLGEAWPGNPTPQ